MSQLLEKSKDKLSESFSSHCVDSWVLANTIVGGHEKPDNKDLLYVTPIKLHRRELHRRKPSKGGVRTIYGGTRSLGFKRGSIVKHKKYGVVYIGGTPNQNRIALHNIKSGKRICSRAKTQDIKFLTYNTWRIR